MNDWSNAKRHAASQGYLPNSTEFWACTLSVFKSRPMEFPEAVDGHYIFENNPHIPRPALIIPTETEDTRFFVSKNKKLKFEVI